MHPDLTNHPRLLVTLAVAFPLCLILLFSFLSAMFQREAVKRDLSERGSAPLRIRWMPFSLDGGYRRTYFHVVFRDESGLLHKARCYVYVSLMDSPFGPRRVKWTKDEIKDAIDV
jgi:hypothetical protein